MYIVHKGSPAEADCYLNTHSLVGFAVRIAQMRGFVAKSLIDFATV